MGRSDDVSATERAYNVQVKSQLDGPDSGRPDLSGRADLPGLAGPPGPPRRGVGEQLRRFVRRHGWRAYALPILVVVTVVALVTAGGHHNRADAAGGAATNPSGAQSLTPKAPPTATGNEALKTDDPAAGSLNSVLDSDALPAGGDYTQQGTGTYSVLPGTSPVVGTGPLKRYSIEVENGITGIDLTQFATTVQTVLSDPRSWTAGTGKAAISIERVDSGPIDFHVTLVSSITVRSLCGYSIPIETSCYAPKGQFKSTTNRVVLNDSRWVRGDAAYIADLASYREYMINHESGHALGHQHAHSCLADGLAPTMMQQTIGLKTASGQLCQANPWPYPPGATDAPGAEAPDTQINNEFNLQNE
jgi:hypothetical protein